MLFKSITPTNNSDMNNSSRIIAALSQISWTLYLSRQSVSIKESWETTLLPFYWVFYYVRNKVKHQDQVSTALSHIA